MAKQIGGFDFVPPKDSFAARVARSENPDAVIDESQLSEKERTALKKASEIDKAAESFVFVSPEQALERVEIVFDNSSSMSGQAIRDAKEGVTEFMKACVPNETAVRITPLNSDFSSSNDVIKFTCNLPTIAAKVTSYTATGNTPLYAKLKFALSKEDNRRTDLFATRIIAFSDGAATDGYARRLTSGFYSTGDIGYIDIDKEEDSQSHKEIVSLAREGKVAIDTCYIAGGSVDKDHDPAYKTMKAIADDTGGVFILFEKGKCDFRRGFKYLTKGNRLLLMDNNFKSKLEAGQI